MIVGFEIEVTTIEAKYKLSQNRPGEDQVAIIHKLEIDNMEIAEFMKQGLEK